MSSGSQSRGNDDTDYCKDVAMRAVARAALHLGVEHMSQDALDVMGDVLISYLETFGRILAANVESSRRTSAHCNILDALQTVELCTVPAVYQIQSSQEQELGDAERMKSSSAVHLQKARGWESLASFIFGPNWLDIPLTNGDGQLSSPHVSGFEPKNGKQGPTVNNTSASASSTSGWNAPYLNSLHYFPLNLGRKANPRTYLECIGESFHDVYAPEEEACQSESVIGRNHVHKAIKKAQLTAPIQSEQSDKLYDYKSHHLLAQAMEEEAETKHSRIPDELFYESNAISFWGCTEQKKGTGESNKATSTMPIRVESMINNMINGTDPEKIGLAIPSTPITGKRVRFDERYEETGNGKKWKSERRRPAYVPNFLPVFPSVKTYGNTFDKWSATQADGEHIVSVVNNRVGGNDVVSSLTETHSHTTVQESYKYNETSMAAVRQSLVDLERSVGPSFWGSIQNYNDNGANVIPSNSTNPQLSQVNVNKGLPKSDQGITPKQVAVIPLGRASGSRVSRIIEGSLDAAIQ